MMYNKNARFIIASCFLVAGIWAGSIITYLAVGNTPSDGYTAQAIVTGTQGTSFADATQARRGRRIINPQNAEPQTTPYNEKTAPPLGDFEFAEPSGPPSVVADSQDETPAADTPDPLTDQITSAVEAFQRLISGKGGVQEIIQLVLFAFLIFGGAKVGSSDTLLKLILGLFSRKASYRGILDECAKKHDQKNS